MSREVPLSRLSALTPKVLVTLFALLAAAITFLWFRGSHGAMQQICASPEAEAVAQELVGAELSRRGIDYRNLHTRLVQATRACDPNTVPGPLAGSAAIDVTVEVFDPFAKTYVARSSTILLSYTGNRWQPDQAGNWFSMLLATPPVPAAR